MKRGQTAKAEYPGHTSTIITIIIITYILHIMLPGSVHERYSLIQPLPHMCPESTAPSKRCAGSAEQQANTKIHVSHRMRLLAVGTLRLILLPYVCH